MTPAQTRDLIANLETIETTAKRMREHLAGKTVHAPLYSHHGYALVNAMYAITECDALYDLRNEIGLDLGIGSDGEPVLHLADRKAA